MSADKRLAAAVNLAEATRAANARPHTDINSTVRQCQASPSHIFVVPVRYALSEEPAKHSAFQFGVKAVSHPAFQPGVETKSHPMAPSIAFGLCLRMAGQGTTSALHHGPKPPIARTRAGRR